MTPWHIYIQHILAILATLGVVSLTSRTTNYIQPGPENADDRQLRKTGIVPYIIEKTPSAKLAEIFPYYVANLLRPPNATRDQVINQPTIIYASEKEAYYTLLMIDPDAPTPQNPNKSQILHWGICNISGSKVTKGTEFAAYLTPTPSTKVQHRYITIIYKQIRLNECSSERFETVEERENFSNMRYARIHELILYAVQAFYCCN